MYLIVAHDFQVMRICRTKYVNPEDLLRAHYRMGLVYSTVSERHKYLNGELLTIVSTSASSDPKSSQKSTTMSGTARLLI